MYLSATCPTWSVHLQDMFAVVGVCKSWRSVGFEQFFLSRWASPEAAIIHPLQLLALVRTSAAAVLHHY
jgi:hypothetical protein